jgi:hypothetical protein
MDYIDAVFYINLESRVDRKDHFLQEVQKLTDRSKVHRINAVRDANGALGCTLSHIKTLKYSYPIQNGIRVSCLKTISHFAVQM